MKKTLLLAAMLLACSVASATAVWDVKLDALHDGDLMTLDGTFTTATAAGHAGDGELITSFSGELTDQLNPGGVSVSLVPTSQNMQIGAGSGQVFSFDNIFFGPADTTAPPTGWSLPDSFSLGGVLLKAGSGYINFYSDAGSLLGYDYNGTVYQAEVGDAFHGDYIRLDHTVSSVDEPIVPALMAMGLAVIVLQRRRQAQR